ncbi:MAG TPA: PA14 domain-containing protein [Planctomycetota bacterium]
MKTLYLFLVAIGLLALSAVFWPLPARASYYSLVASSHEAKECIIFDVRYPYWTKQIYIATYPNHSFSKEGWTAPYYGGIVSDTGTDAKQLIQFASWQMGGKGAPTSGIDFVHAGPYMGWQRSTWEGSSGGIKGHWPNDKFQPGQWYRFVHRVWTPATPVPHLGYAGVWMKSLETGEWSHLATFKFPAELTGFNDMGGFMEYFGGQAPDKVAAEFRNSYVFCNGQWTSKPAFSAFSHKADGIRLTPGENNRSITLETTKNPIDPETKKPKLTPVVTEKFTLQQPEKPDFFDAAKIEAVSAERMGNQLVVRWSVDSKSSPQLGYSIEVFDGANCIAKAAENDPEARQCNIALPAAPQGEISVRMTLRDICNQTSPEARCAVTPSVPLTPSAEQNLHAGLSYRYYESEKAETWTALPDFAKLTPKRSGTTAAPDITPRLRRNGYAFQFDGSLRVPTDGLYTFNLVAASGAKMALANKTVIDADGNHSIARHTGTAPLKAGLYPLLVAYYHGQGRFMQADDFLQMTWSGPGFATTPVPGTAFAHAAAEKEPALTVEARIVNGIRLELSSRLTGFTGKLKRVEYYAVNDQFDYYSQQGATSADYFLAATDKPEERLSAPIWGGANKIVRARAVLDDNRTVDSPALVVSDTTPARATDENGMQLTSLEHHLYPMNSATEDGSVTIVGESMGLLTRPHKGDITLVAHLAGLTSNQALPDGTRLESAGNWYSGIILRENLNARPGEPLGGAQIPYIALLASADGATRHCDSTMINGAGNQPSGDVGRASKWFKLTRKGAELSAFISKDGKDWKQVKTITLPKMKPDYEIGFVHYALPSATPAIHWAKFDNISIHKDAQ